MINYFLAIFILWPTPACYNMEHNFDPPSVPIAHSNKQIDDTDILVRDISKLHPSDMFNISLISPSVSKPHSNKKIGDTRNLVDYIRNLYLSDRFSDVILVVDGERLPAHRSVLASRCEYFRASFSGKFKKTNDVEVTITDAPLTLFKILLEYIYTGRINLSGIEDGDIFELVRLSDFFDISNLNLSLHKCLQKNITVQNVCSFLELARNYQYKDLVDESLNLIDENAFDVLQSEEFLSLSPDDLQEIFHRDTFYADELFIFRAACRWIKKNQNELDRGTKINVLSAVRHELMSVEELVEAKQSQLVSLDIISDAIKFRNTWSTHKPQFRGQLKPNKNLRYKSKSIPHTDYHIEGTNMIKLSTPSTINYMEITEWYEYRIDQINCFSYYIEVSIDGQNWVRLIDHSNYNCRTYQYLWFHPRLVRYIHIVGTNSTANKIFIFWQVMYNTEDMHNVEVKNGLVVPKFGYDVSSEDLRAFVIKGRNNSNDGSLVESYEESNARKDRYTYHVLGSGGIVVQLAQPYILSSMRLLLWDDDACSYTVDASVDNKDWERIVNKSNELTQSWQVLKFTPRPILYIRIIGVKCAAGNVFRVIYLEVPAQVTLDSNVVEDDRAVTNDGFSDVVLVVDGERIPAHRSVLAARSEYFRVLLYGVGKKTYKKHVEISDAPVTLVKVILEYIYTGRIKISVLEGIEDCNLPILRGVSVYFWNLLTKTLSNKQSYMSGSSSSKADSNEQIDHTRFLVGDIGNLYLKVRFSDVFLDVNGEKLAAHRSVLASRSKFFDRLLYGDFKETYESHVQISEAPVSLFKIILKYIYSGRINLSGVEGREVFELLKISDYFDIPNLKLSLHEYLQRSFNVQNVCSFFAMARLYQYKELQVESLNLIENNVLDILKSEDFLSLTSGALQDILNRDTFYADELVIFREVCRWINNNQNELDRDTEIHVLSAVRYHLMSNGDLSKAKESKLVSSDIISDAIQLSNTWSTDKPQFRGQIKPNVRLDYQSHSSPVTNVNLIHRSQGFSVLNNRSGTNVIKLNTPSIINYVDISLWREHRIEIMRCYSYYIEVSIDGQHWERLIDYSNYNCRSRQRLWIHPRIVRYIHIVGTDSTATFRIWDVRYNTIDMHKWGIENGFVVPKDNETYNVASESVDAIVIEGKNSNNRRTLLNAFIDDYDRYRTYTYHLLESGFIVVHLTQPYILSSMRLLLWGNQQ
ncbi:uncharacterized protein LOC126836909 [Adelges cooleyi]|uniref:uncharacterized protein LOC126836909 n=1 Tax=Adelges cooleyi TaxID=133065 RepID=UPI0021805BBA|nr:uncharacterized protein LOC126836909 [Adelges cooleyi]